MDPWIPAIVPDPAGVAGNVNRHTKLPFDSVVSAHRAAPPVHPTVADEVAPKPVPEAVTDVPGGPTTTLRER